MGSPVSWQATEWAWRQQVSGGAKLVLVALAERADRYGVTWSGHRDLAAMTGMSPRALVDNLRRLEEDGLVARFRRARGNGSRTSDWTVLAPLDLDRGQMDDHPDDERPGDVFGCARRGLSADSARADPAGPKVQKRGGPEPTVEPSVERVVSASAREVVWAHYQAVVPNAERQRFDPQRKAIVDFALGIRTVEECCEAIDGLMRSDYHVGNQYLDVKYALRGGGSKPSPDATITRMIGIARQQVNGSGNGKTANGERLYFGGRRWAELSSAEQYSARQMINMGRDPV